MQKLNIFLSFIFLISLNTKGNELILLKIDTIYQFVENDISEVYPRSEEVIKLSKKNGYGIGVGSGYFCKGLYFEHTNKTDSALIYYNQAIEIYKKHNDKDKIASCYNTMASLYNKLTNYKLAIKYNKKAYTIYENLKDSLSMADLLNNSANIYVNMEPSYKNLVIDNYKKAFDIYKSLNVLESKFSIHINLGIQYEEEGNYAKALKFFNKGLELALKKESITKEIGARINLSYVLSKTDKFIEAQTQLIKAYNLAENYDVLSDQLLVVDAYINLFEKKEDYKSALIWTKIKQELENGLSQEKFNHFAIKTETELNLAKKENEIKELILQKEVDKRKNSLMILGFGVVFILVVLFYYFKRKEYLNKKEIAVQKRLLLKEKLERAELEKTNINKDLENRKKLLANFAVHITQKNEMLQNIQKEIKSISKSKGDLSKELLSLSVELKQQLLVSKDVEEFNFQLNSINDKFYKDLEVLIPNLTKNEKKMAALLRLGLTSKEIALTNFSSESAVKIARHRLRKKINLPSNENLGEYFKNLEL